MSSLYTLQELEVLEVLEKFSHSGHDIWWCSTLQK